VSRLLRFLKAHPDVVSVETDSALAVPEALAVLARQEVELLAINGGDGTIQHALTEILANRTFDRLPLIAPLRGGRTNMTALDLGARRDPVRGMAELIAAAREGGLEERTLERKVLRVQYGPDRELMYGMFFGGGMIYRAIELNHKLFKKDSRSQGVVGATLVTAGLVGQACFGGAGSGILTPNKVQILLDGDPISTGEFLMVISTTLRRLFAGMRPFWGTGLGGVRFTAVSSDARNVAGAFAGIMRGRPRAFVNEENGYLSRNVKCAEMRFDCGFTVDGELVMPDPGCVATLTADDTVQFVRA
jgi:hypothetical protein